MRRRRGRRIVPRADAAADRDDGAADDARTHQTIVTPYEVRRGDTLSAIATAHSVPVDAVLAANPEIASADDIHEGQIIQIPAPSPVTSTAVDQ